MATGEAILTVTAESTEFSASEFASAAHQPEYGPWEGLALVSAVVVIHEEINRTVGDSRIEELQENCWSKWYMETQHGFCIYRKSQQEN